MIHDETTERTGGRDRPVAGQTLAELRELDVGAWKGPAFTGERIPTLAEVIAAVPEGRALCGSSASTGGKIAACHRGPAGSAAGARRW